MQEFAEAEHEREKDESEKDMYLSKIIVNYIGVPWLPRVRLHCPIVIWLFYCDMAIDGSIDVVLFQCRCWILFRKSYRIERFFSAGSVFHRSSPWNEFRGVCQLQSLD